VRSFIDIAREAHERAEAAKRTAEQRALAQREQAARDARDVALRQSFHESRSRPVYREAAGASDESYRDEPSGGGYNSSSYCAENYDEGGEEEEEKGGEDDEEDDDEGWTH